MVNQKRNFFNKRIPSAFVLSIGINFIFLCLYLLLGPAFETNDDWSIAWQLSSGAGSYSTFFCPYLSLIFIILYSHFHSIPWWSVCSFLSGCFLLLILTYMTLKRVRGLLRYLLIAFWFVLVWVVCIENINFTRTAVLLSLAGGLLIYQSLYEYKKRNVVFSIEIILGISVFFLGFFVRFQGALLVIPFLMVAFGYNLLYAWSKKTITKRTVTSTILAIVSLVVIAFVAQAITTTAWNQRESWKEYQSYNTLRSSIQDYANNYPSWSEAEKEYQDIGFQKGDEKMVLFEWFSEDTSIYNSAALEKMSTMYQDDANRITMVKEVLKELLKNPVFWIMLLSFLCVFCLTSDKKLRFALSLNIIGAAACVLYFTLLGRMMSRIYEPIFLCVIVNMFLALKFCAMEKLTPFFNKNKYAVTIEGKKEEARVFSSSFIISPRKVVFILFFSIICFFLIGSNLLNIIPSDGASSSDNEVRAKMDYINDTKDRVYLIPTLSDNWASSFDFWEPVPVDYCSNLFFLGGWPARSPINVDRLKEYDITNPTESLFINDFVYSLNDSNIFHFIKRHYGMNITATQVDVLPSGTNVIVKYKEPYLTDKNETAFKEYPNDITFEYLSDIDVWYLQVEEYNKYECLYCNFEIGGEEYTYFLEDKGEKGYDGYFIEFTPLLRNAIESSYLLGKTKNGEVEYLGSINNEVQKEIIEY